MRTVSTTAWAPMHASQCAICNRHVPLVVTFCALHTLQEVADLISQCMALEPSERPTAQQLMQRLQQLQKPGAQQPGTPGMQQHPTPGPSSKGTGSSAVEETLEPQAAPSSAFQTGQ